ncbi:MULTISPECIES: homocysteine S-methyltransferase family protein [Pseudomonas]|uniref:homocysteine S-methyltransferase family protein n=1 Tax=Pseudomonas TaxID=286 RepID=UPI0015B536D6|nr:hypothetical protein [Pseudomonas fulva]MBA1215396.1 hypothetical protein [Pseudomonas fulva]
MTANSYAVAPFTCATIIGGCCGIRPEHIEQLREHIGIEPEGIAPSGGLPRPAAVFGEARPGQLLAVSPARRQDGPESRRTALASPFTQDGER